MDTAVTLQGSSQRAITTPVCSWKIHHELKMAPLRPACGAWEDPEPQQRHLSALLFSMARKPGAEASKRQPTPSYLT